MCFEGAGVLAVGCCAFATCPVQYADHNTYDAGLLAQNNGT